MAAQNKGLPVSPVVRFKAHNLLKATNRMTNVQGYEASKQATERLAGTRISTNILAGQREFFKAFGLIEWATIVRETRDGRMQDVEVKLADWLYQAVCHKEALTLHRDYFRLRNPLERRMYELARKHGGRKSEWQISLTLLQKKCGVTPKEKELRRLVSKIVQEDQRHQHFPDYSIDLDDGRMIIFRNRNTMPSLAPVGEPLQIRQLMYDVYESARAVAPGWDVYYLEQEWRGWITAIPRDPEAAFIGFCKKRFERCGRP